MRPEKTAKPLRQLRALSRKSRKMRLAAEAWDAPWKTLIATMMSAQSRDETTIPIAQELFRKYPSLKSLAAARYSGVLSALRSLNYNRTKAKNVIACANALMLEHGGEVPEDFGKLIALPGVGRKTANVFLSERGHDAIGIDTHAAYISQKLGWTRHRNPEKIEADLQRLFPKRYWKIINPTLVRFGKTYTGRKEKDRLLEEIRRMK